MEKSMKICIKLAKITLFFAVVILLCRFVLLPHIFPKKYQQEINYFCQQYELAPSLVYAVIFTESRFDKNAISSKDAKGLMQIREATGEWAAGLLDMEQYQKQTLFEANINIQIGCWYLNKLTNQFGTTQIALAAYNAGSGNVSKWLQDSRYSDDGITLKEIPYGETKRYVKKVMLVQKIYQWLYGIL